jgi:hypothetical protein
MAALAEVPNATLYPGVVLTTPTRKERVPPVPTHYLEGHDAPTLGAIGVGAKPSAERCALPFGDSRSQQRRGFPTSGGHGGVEVRLNTLPAL